MEFGDKLMELRKERGWSQEELGNMICVSRQTVSKWELGQTTPEMNKLIELSSLFQITVDELVGKETGYQEKADFLENGKRTLHFEYKSKKEVKGMPLVHVNIGLGKYKAKGVLAIGTMAKGIFALGILAKGIFSLGIASLGIFSTGLASMGLLSMGSFSLGVMAMGGIALGIVAFGGMAIGVVTFGGLSIGVYSVGGMAVAARVAAGGSANAPIAIGDTVTGDITFSLGLDSFTKEDVRAAILNTYPGTWKMIIEWILLFVSA